MTTKTRAFLKWAGGKFALVEEIARRLPDADRLVEPFVGAGSVFLNTNYPSYLLSDINPDLINLYQTLKHDADHYIVESRKLFVAEQNNKEAYYLARQRFNDTNDQFERAMLFLYLNRHGYNGLCRYNKKGGFNVPFGSYKRPYFPQKEMEFFAEKAQRATFLCADYHTTFAQVRSGDAVYCDPPYLPLSATASFTSYASGGFNLEAQHALAGCARDAAAKGVSVLISNHDTGEAREIYQEADRQEFLMVKRTISPKGNGRKKVNEIFAGYGPAR
ncbi:Dam family site-specific DNA-(adenine-N6)-methyltransferase [Ferrimonas sediminicola]|uniref:Site-specific DNA-methyltransferase (adenine-specific) n=1 Tax=Ferrimonas sediminicola TaxID=2569538 RepID=A0A4U1BAW3_9GAMM|nr:Dam family site-specific DNA-(adenine-N6)-methyltransferase [Ferrimonas sediminicola]TKB48024.1 Dam family site-specific DNA-(adenine-N6)-methyltransferase [Ferrimonas sediminicola]